MPRAGTDGTVGFQVRDVAPWGHLALTVDGSPARLESWWESPGGIWTWQWSFSPSAAQPPVDVRGAAVILYRDCDTGCIERSRVVVDPGKRGTAALSPANTNPAPTKLGVVFANPERDWHGRSGWDVEVTYARLADDPFWGVDHLASRVQGAIRKGLKVLVRVDYDRGQSLPPTDDNLALAEYLRYVRRLARDDRLQGAYGYVVGSGFNAPDANSLSAAQAVTPRWYARIFNGYGQPVSRNDNVVQTVRPENSRARVLVGPVRPWVSDQNGDILYRADVPWLNYMNTLVSALDDSAQARAEAGQGMAAPDGFALQAPGRAAAPELHSQDASEEPGIDLRRAEWGGAQAGFRVYRDWLDIINSYATTRGLPAYITSTNTFAPDDGIPPAQNYPRGWLTAALQVIDKEPQIMALIWFMDGPMGDNQWEWFSLGRPVARVIDAAEELDILLQQKPQRGER